MTRGELIDCGGIGVQEYALIDAVDRTALGVVDPDDGRMVGFISPL